MFFQRVTFRLIPHNVTLYNPAICDNWCRNHCMLPLHVTAEYSRCSLQQPRNCLVMDSASPNSPLATEEARGAPSYGSCWGAQFQVSCGAECTPNFIPGKRHSMVRRTTLICRAGRRPPPTARGTLTHAHGDGLVSSTQSCGRLGLAALNKAATPLSFGYPAVS